jgi:hypothetical protein
MLWTPQYPDNRPAALRRMPAQDHGIVLTYGSGPDQCDRYGARDPWVFEADGIYYLHYDGGGEKGWLCIQVTSSDGIAWTNHGAVLQLGAADARDSRSASYGTTYYDGANWHMFYLGTPNTSPAPDRIPAFPYLTMKARGESAAGPWHKQYDVVPFRPKPGTYYADTASPGHIIRQGDQYLQFFSASMSEGNIIKRTLGIARTDDLQKTWTIDPEPIVSLDEQIENSSLYFEPESQLWFLFTNHVGIEAVQSEDSAEPIWVEYTDAVWVYWSRDLNRWNADDKAVVLDRNNCAWSPRIIGLPSVLKIGDRLALYYDGREDARVGNERRDVGYSWHMQRDIGLAWLDLPLTVETITEGRT